jgi:hypothetical protein
MLPKLILFLAALNTSSSGFSMMPRYTLPSRRWPWTAWPSLVSEGNRPHVVQPEHQLTREPEAYAPTIFPCSALDLDLEVPRRKAIYRDLTYIANRPILLADQSDLCGHKSIPRTCCSSPYDLNHATDFVNSISWRVRKGLSDFTKVADYIPKRLRMHCAVMAAIHTVLH